VSTFEDQDRKPDDFFSDDEDSFITPDVYIIKVGDEYEIIQDEDSPPELQIGSYFKKVAYGKDPLSEEAKAHIQEKLKSPAWLIRSIHQQQSTLYRVTQSIISFQMDFLEKGITHLKPLVLRDVAEDIGMHESTVSRVVTNRYVHTPQGLFELKFFFNSSIPTDDGEPIGSESVKELIWRIVQTENRAKPHSDQIIVETLEKMNIKVARRTVAKYRDSMGIPPSGKRRTR